MPIDPKIPEGATLLDETRRAKARKRRQRLFSISLRLQRMAKKLKGQGKRRAAEKVGVVVFSDLGSAVPLEGETKPGLGVRRRIKQVTRAVTASTELEIASSLVQAHLPLPIDFGEGVTAEDAFQMFMSAAHMVWKDPVLFAKIKFTWEQVPDKDMRNGVMASLTSSGKQRASGNVLMQASHYYHLKIADRLLLKPYDFIKKVMIHESVHIGYTNHGKDFREIVQKYKGSLTESSADSEKPFKLEQKFGARYKPVAEFHTEGEALADGKRRRKEDPSLNFRIKY